MFEDQMKVDAKSWNITPVLVAIGLVLVIVGGIAYCVTLNQRSLSDSQAQQAASQLLAAQGPEKVRFWVGKIKPETAVDPRYKFLEGLGVIKLGKPSADGVDVALTPQGDDLLKSSGAMAVKHSDGTLEYSVPLATGKLVKVSAIEKVDTERVSVDFGWAWAPTKMGLQFDAGSPLMASMNSWDRALLIQNYGVDYYKQPQVKEREITLIWDGSGWRPVDQARELTAAGRY